MAEITGQSQDGDFLVTHDGVTAPASLDQLKQYPDLYAQAVSLSTGSATDSGAQQPGIHDAGLPQHDDSQPGPGVEPAGGPSPLVKFLAPGNPANPTPGAIGTNPDGTPMMPPPDAMMASALTPPAPVVSAAPPAAVPGVVTGTAGNGVPRGTVRASPVLTGAAADAAKPGPGGDNFTGGQNSPPVQPVAQPAAAPAEDPQDELVRRTVAEQGRIKQQGLNQEQDNALAESAWQEQNRAWMADQGTRYAALRDQALAAHANVPDKWWSNKSALGQIFFAIANIAQGVGLGAAGHPEKAGDLVDNLIKRNIEVQSQKAASLDKAAEAQGNLVQLGRQMGLDHRAAYLAAIPLQREMVARNVEQAAYKVDPTGRAPFSLAGLQVVQGLRQKNEETRKTGQEANLAGAGTLEKLSGVQMAPLKARQIAGETAASLGAANASNASAQHTRAETDLLSQQRGAIGDARNAAARGQPISPDTRLRLPPEMASQFSADGYPVGANAVAKVDDLVSKHWQLDASLRNMQNLVARKRKGDAVSAQDIKDAQDASNNAAKNYWGEHRREGESEDQAVQRLAPGFRERVMNALKSNAPGDLDASSEAIKGTRRAVYVVTNGGLSVYKGHPGIPMPLDVSANAPNFNQTPAFSK
jgi:hypothetical protein